MKFLKYLAVLPLAFSLINTAQAKGEIFYFVPFHNVEVKPASKIYINYHINSYQVLYCQTDKNDAITSAEWEYKNASRKIELPVVLKDSRNFGGHYADPEGLLTITNEFGSGAANGSIFVTCEYGRG